MSQSSSPRNPTGKNNSSQVQPRPKSPFKQVFPSHLLECGRSEIHLFKANPPFTLQLFRFKFIFCQANSTSEKQNHLLQSKFIFSKQIHLFHFKFLFSKANSHFAQPIRLLKSKFVFHFKFHFFTSNSPFAKLSFAKQIHHFQSKFTFSTFDPHPHPHPHPNPLTVILSLTLISKP